MHTAEDTLALRLQDALVTAFGPEHAHHDPLLRDATRPEFGHLQTNLPLRLAKPLGLAPREVGARLIDALEVADLCLPPQLAGAGFVNLTWRPDVLAARVNAMLADPRLGVRPAEPAQRVVVDYSSPNVAKEMHVGHLRSTVIGDALARVLAYAGHDVLRQNHLGDWGTQFGMLIEQLVEEDHDGGDLDLAALDVLYKRARAHFDTDPGFQDRSRRRVVALQAHEPATTEVWERLVAVSLASFDATYVRMGALLTDDDLAPESGYNDALPGVVADLRSAGLLTESDGALCAFVPGYAGRDGSPLPLIVRKADGGYGYDATDLAAVRHRVDALGVDRIVYVVDARQSLHFDLVLALAREAGWLPDRVTAEHVAFGTVMGPDGRPFKTRSGDTVALGALLDAAEAKAGRAIGIGAVKYADLSNDLARDYVFDVDRMVATDGNTGPYLQYAHARLATLLARTDHRDASVSLLDHAAEQRLAVALAGFPDEIDTVASTLRPHHLCGYLYRLAVAFSSFYEHCPVLRSAGETRTSRVALCVATRRVLATGLGLLGIEAPDTM